MDSITLEKVPRRNLDEVKDSMARVVPVEEERAERFRMFAAVPSGRRIWVIW